jgi:hypothetical protein
VLPCRHSSLSLMPQWTAMRTVMNSVMFSIGLSLVQWHALTDLRRGLYVLLYLYLFLSSSSSQASTCEFHSCRPVNCPYVAVSHKGVWGIQPHDERTKWQDSCPRQAILMFPSTAYTPPE